MGALSRYEVVLEWAMSESVSVRCPACRREHLYAAPVYPCECGTAVAPALDPGGTATAVTHRAWDEEWVRVRCGSCDRENEWPRPELACPCGTTLRVPVAEAEPDAGAAQQEAPPTRRAFQPITIRTARDAVTAAAVYLRWLGYRDIRRADQRPPTGIGIAAHGLLAQAL